MKAFKLTGIKKMELFDVPAPTIQEDHEVLIRVTTLGVCGSDIHYYTTGRIGSQVVQYPFTVGHECAGIIEKTGAKVKSLKPGDRVAIDPAMPCYTCDQCLSGRQHTCRKLKFLGCPGQAEGALSEYLVMPEKSCFKIPQNMTLEQAALSEPLSIGYYAVQLASVKKGAHAAILGFGPIGMSVLKCLQHQQLGKLFVTDLLPERLSISKKSGATYAGNPENQDIVKEIQAIEPGGMDFVFECCGKQEATDQALELLKPGGKLVMVGIPEFDRFSFSADLLRRKEIAIQNVRRQNECVEPVIKLIASGNISVDDMATHHFSFNQTPEAFELVGNYRDGVMKAMINY